MKKMLIVLLLGVSLVSCGAKREVNSITNNEFSDQSFFIDENDFNKKEVMELIKKDIEKVDNMYNGYASLIKTKNYIILYEVEYVRDNDYGINIVELWNGDKDFINHMYPEVKNYFDKVWAD